MTGILLPEVDIIINTNASESGWGATNRSPTGGYGTKMIKNIILITEVAKGDSGRLLL